MYFWEITLIGGNFLSKLWFLLFAFTLEYPEHVFLLRGNHEFASVNKNYGFYAQIIKLFETEELWNDFQSAFSFMPLVAITLENILLLHGGIGENFNKLDQIRQKQRPIVDFSGSIESLMWSDPSTSVNCFEPSPRGSGVLFGWMLAQTFLKENQIKLLIRGHQCVPTGISYLFHRSVLTVFSASNYHSEQSNFCGYIKIQETGTIETFSLPPFRPLMRDETFFSSARRSLRAMSDLSVHLSQRSFVTNSLSHSRNLSPTSFLNSSSSDPSALANCFKAGSLRTIKPFIPSNLPTGPLARKRSMHQIPLLSLPDENLTLGVHVELPPLESENQS